MAARKILIIEGESNSPNGDLRQGFAKLLEQSLKGKMPVLKLGDGKSQAIKKFLKYSFEGIPCLVIDLDSGEANLEKDIQENSLSNHTDRVFYMVQEMEAWFISQPEVLDKFYGKDNNGKKVSEKIPKKHPSEIAHPDEFLNSILVNTKKKKYHKITHAVQLLMLLNSEQLMNDFIEYKRMIEYLR